MKKYLVLYFSKTGNSKFVAQRIAEMLSSDLREIQASVSSIGWLLFLSWLKIPVRVDLSPQTLEPYEEIVIIGPIWGGTLIAPLQSALRKCSAAQKTIHFALTCETADKDKDTKYGYEGVLAKARAVGGERVHTTKAFSTTWVKASDEPWRPKLSEKVKITQENYRGTIKNRVEAFVQAISPSA